MQPDSTWFTTTLLACVVVLAMVPTLIIYFLLYTFVKFARDVMQVICLFQDILSKVYSNPQINVHVSEDSDEEEEEEDDEAKGF